MLYDYYNSTNKSYKNYNLLSSWWINNVGMNWNSAKAKKLTNWKSVGNFDNNGLKRIYSELNSGNPVILYLTRDKCPHDVVVYGYENINKLILTKRLFGKQANFLLLQYHQKVT